MYCIINMTRHGSSKHCIRAFASSLYAIPVFNTKLHSFVKMPSMVSFECLTPLLKIVTHEKSYKIQLLTVESHQTILNIFKHIGLVYRVTYRSMKNTFNLVYTNKLINVVINDTENDVFEYDAGACFILIGGCVVHGLLHVVFTFKQDEACEYLREMHLDEQYYMNEKNNKAKTLQGKKKGVLKRNTHPVDEQKTVCNAEIDLLIKKYYKFYTLTQLSSQMKPSKQQIIPDLSWLESALIFSLCYFKKFGDILRNIQKMNNEENNSFKILMALNKLVKYGFVKKRAGSYSLMLSKEGACAICTRIGYDLKKETEINGKC
ncbi:hypothetical protein THOM_0417 [Trachipleistophora hominis]|uniref:Uncharacterized protein n=1 Tax=Trachipleistophora hominis TaxID=72359 RepID=L7K054_TRAHO|nr:hypothetical protein THOM_0417 [Trachipleistophora hominis]